METAVDVLREEHRMTRRMVGVLRQITNRIGGHGEFPADDVAVVLSYFREFVEHVHHSKESVALYPLAAMDGDDRVAGCVGELIADHDESKMLLHSLTLFWEPSGLLLEEQAAFAQLARTYADRLMRHMECEEETLFPAAEAVPGDDQIRMREELDAVERGVQSGRDWRREIERLEAVYSCRP